MRRRSSNSNSNNTSSVLHARVSARTASPGASSTTYSSSYDSCEGYVRIKKRSALTWSTRFAVLRGAELYVFYSKQDATLRRNLVDAFTVASGRIAPRMDLGLELLAADAREFQARVFSRGDLARWVTAFHRLAVRTEAAEAAAAASSVPSASGAGVTAGAPRATRAKRMRIGSVDSAMPSPVASVRASERSSAYTSEAQTDGADETVYKSDNNNEDENNNSDDDDGDEEEERNPVVLAPSSSATPQTTSGGRQPSARRRVSFNGSVMVRLIPALEQEQVAELFYSKKEVERFSVQATSLLSRTEDAVSCAYLALRRGPTTLLPWRRQVA